MKIVTFAVALAGLALSTVGAAQAADNHATLEIGYTNADWHAGKDFDLSAINLRGGYQFTKNWGVEMEGDVGVANANLAPGVSVKEDWEVGFYGVGYLPVGHNIDLYARAGYARTQATVSSTGFSEAAQDYGAAVGVGVRQFIGGGANGWRIDYTHHFYNNSDTLDTFSVGYVRRF